MLSSSVPQHTQCRHDLSLIVLQKYETCTLHTLIVSHDASSSTVQLAPFGRTFQPLLWMPWPEPGSGLSSGESGLFCHNLEAAPTCASAFCFASKLSILKSQLQSDWNPANYCSCMSRKSRLADPEVSVAFSAWLGNHRKYSPNSTLSSALPF